ncbi:hypothetical protein [Actinoplanes sp. NPDC049265]|uniref:hypothetical protein n=1 Tax=Actinoplanes sp. NPDC049265 TaxID=3363902 RepID=UPI003710E7D3
MTRRRWVAVAIVCFLLGAASALWFVFLAKQGLGRADQWSSIVGAAATIVFGVAGVFASRRDPQREPRRSAAQPVQRPSSEPPAGEAGPSGETPARPSPAPPAGGSTFNISAKTSYSAHEMTVHQPRDD